MSGPLSAIYDVYMVSHALHSLKASQLEIRSNWMHLDARPGQSKAKPALTCASLTHPYVPRLLGARRLLTLQAPPRDGLLASSPLLT